MRDTTQRIMQPGIENATSSNQKWSLPINDFVKELVDEDEIAANAFLGQHAAVILEQLGDADEELRDEQARNEIDNVNGVTTIEMQ